MPEDDLELGEEQIEEIVRAVEAEQDDIAVPGELLVEVDPGAPPPPRTLYAQILAMTIGQKIKLALRGNKDARSILIRDVNKLIRRFVLQNPRITDGEVLTISRNRTADEELIRVIADKREWIRNYQIRHALVQNPKTPVAIALKHVATLEERDVRMLSRSKHVPQAVAAQCRRIIFTRQQPE
jgi:hypothetical protein